MKMVIQGSWDGEVISRQKTVAEQLAEILAKNDRNKILEEVTSREEFRAGLAARNKQRIIMQMVNEEDEQRELLAEADDYTFGDNTDREE